jgi:hypothetical protein
LYWLSEALPEPPSVILRLLAVLGATPVKIGFAEITGFPLLCPGPFFPNNSPAKGLGAASVYLQMLTREEVGLHSQCQQTSLCHPIPKFPPQLFEELLSHVFK